jgi:hypothetical protein
MQSLELMLELETLSISRKGTISGEVWLRIEGMDFPEPNWSDLPVAFSSSLLEATVRLQSSSNAGEQTVWFLDGPYYIRLEGARDVPWKVAFCALGQERPPSKRVDSASFLASLRRAASALAAECRTRSWENADTRALNDLLAKI